MPIEAEFQSYVAFVARFASSNTSRPKEKIKEDFKQYYGVNVEDDSTVTLSTHPMFVGAV